MKRAWTLLTALPPTKGHLRLIQFTSELGGGKANVILATQPSEPYGQERYEALHKATHEFAWIHWYHQEVEQNPEAPGFWDKWKEIFQSWGWQEGDILVTSEMYGKKLAEVLEGQWMPYDVDREMYPCKATHVRNGGTRKFNLIIPEFQQYLRQRVTIFGCESTGKTTLSKNLATKQNAHWTFEYARPLLEKRENVINDDVMTDIWHGQAALQRQTDRWIDKAWVIQDTDLFSTVGYWEFWKPGECPEGLIKDAIDLKSDLYIITQSNIPFEVDPLRYGGDKRESDDKYWIDLCEQYGLNYVVLESGSIYSRIQEAEQILEDHWLKNVNLQFHRTYNGELT
jgi:NadR type nicotinamide-nucleotide adenylyltransferase